MPVGSQSERAEVLEAIAAQLAEVSARACREAVVRVLDSDPYRGRHEMVSDLCALAPAIVASAGPGVAPMLDQEIERVIGWWP